MSKIIQTDARSGNDIIVFTTKKAASIYLYRLCKRLTDLKKINFYSINHPCDSPFFFDHSLSNFTQLSNWKGKHGCFGPLRMYKQIPNLDAFKIILHLRDPRDVLVSLYYSDAYSHTLKDDNHRFSPTLQERKQARKLGVNAYAIEKADLYLHRYNEYLDHLAGKQNVILVKYEDMIFNYKNWLTNVIEPFQFEHPDILIDQIIEEDKDKFKIKKSILRPFKIRHKRKVTPGDHKEKLTPETINILNEKFKYVLNKLDYDI